MKLIPVQDKVVIRPIKEAETTSASGFIIQRNETDIPAEGIVEAVGPGLVFPNGERLVIDLNVGDKVAYAKFSGTEVDDLIVIAYKDILAVLGDS